MELTNFIKKLGHKRLMTSFNRSLYLHNSRFYSSLFLVPEPGNKWRPVIDLSVLDKFLLVPNFKMGTAVIFGNSVIKGEWLVSIDLKDAFFHVPIHPDSQHWLYFHVDKQTYQFKALPLRLVTAPL